VIRYEPSPDGLAAVAEVVVGTAHRVVRLPLGLVADPDHLDPFGLRQTPVVTAGSPALTTLVEAGIRRAGGSPAVAVVSAVTRGLPGRFLGAVSEGAEVIVVDGPSAAALVAARVLGGRALVALPFDGPQAMAELFGALTIEGSEVDVHAVVPALDDVRRAEVRALSAPLRLEDRHHLIEVDPRPAFDELGRDAAAAPIVDLAAAAAGVLAGRLTAANRRWRRSTG